MIVLICMGVGFRIYGLEDKTFWVDEVATAIRVAGHTRMDVIQQVADGQWLGIEDLQRYTQFPPNHSLTNTLDALLQSPEHTPLYFLLTHLWVQRFGMSIAAFRSLSIGFSMLTLPCLYWLCLELFASRLVGAIALCGMAVSPFFVSYAQEARPYSLWILLLISSSAALLRALRRHRNGDWLLYGITVALSGYTSLLSLPVIAGQGIYAIATGKVGWSGKQRKYWLAVGGGLLTLLPWIGLVLTKWEVLQTNTTWMREPLSLPAMLAIWLYGITILVFDVPIAPLFSSVMLGQIALSTGILIVFFVAVYHLCSRTPRSIWLFVLTLTLSTPLPLIGIDLLMQGQRSTAPRYLIPCHLGILLAVAYLLAPALTSPSQQPMRSRYSVPWKWVALLLLTLSILSCVINLQRSPKYLKSRNLHNPAIAAMINPAQAPHLLAEADEAIDILSLSYDLDPDVQIRILPSAELQKAIASCTGIVDRSGRDWFLFNPSPQLQDALSHLDHLKLTKIYQPEQLTPGELVLSLWQISCINPSSKTVRTNALSEMV